VIVGDIGGAAWYHVGDEAMLAANISWLRRLRPGLVLTAISGDPTWTAEHYRVNAVPQIGFATKGVDLARLWTDIHRNVELLKISDPIALAGTGAEVITAIANADAVIVSGGGNLCSFWPAHVYDRMAIVRIAHAFNKRILVIGQTIGPNLDFPQRQLLERTLSLADVVGVREVYSASLVESLGIDKHLILNQLDDAWFLSSTAPTLIPSFLKKSRPWIGLTFAPFSNSTLTDNSLRALVEQLSTIADMTGAELVFMPHWAAPPHCNSDSSLAQRIIDLLGERISAVLLPIYTAEEACWVTRQASMIVSSRYHPIVFGLSGHVPCFGIYSNEYTRVRQMGALRHANQEEWAMDLSSCLSGGLAKAAIALWERRTAVREHLISCQDHWQQIEIGKWSRLSAILDWQTVDVGLSSFQ